MKNTPFLMRICLIGNLVTLTASATEPADSIGGKNFEENAAFVKEHVPTVVLTDESTGAKVLVAPSLQGRVFTSTTGGQDGPGFGWINFKLLADGKIEPHINAFGGEDRLWLGPEGGQFGLYFPPGSPFDFAHWQTPPPLDTEPFDIVKQQTNEVALRKDFRIVNYSGTTFDVRIDRKVRILTADEIWSFLKMSPQKGVKVVAYQSNNQITNVGSVPWKKETGLLSIWILGQFNASPQATVMIPYRKGTDSDLGKIVESNYFGSVPPDRLKTSDGVIYFKVDSHFRSKIGLSAKRAIPLIGSYDAANHLLTVIQSSPIKQDDDYVNSLWKHQDNPFSGSAINSYNDGPNDTGTQLGNFYEIESSSPALALSANQTGSHFQRTIHLYGNPEELAPIALHVLGVDLKALGGSFTTADTSVSSP